MAVRQQRGVTFVAGEALHNAPSAVAGSAGKLAREGAAELDQHQVDGLGHVDRSRLDLSLGSSAFAWFIYHTSLAEQAVAPRCLRKAELCLRSAATETR